MIIKNIQLKEGFIGFLILSISMTMLLINLASTLEMSITTPSQTFRVNQSDTINHYLGVENKNPYPIQIQIQPPEKLNIIFHNTLNFTLQPNKTRNINYTITPNEHGNFTHFIGVMFISEEQSFGLQAKINLIVYPNQKSPFWMLSIIIILGISLIIIFFILSELPLHKRSGFLIHSQLPKGLTSTPKAYQAVPALQENEE